MKTILLALVALSGFARAEESSIQQTEKQRELTENVTRDLWKFTVAPHENEVVLATFRVEPDVKLSTEGLPKAQVIESIHYVPKGSVDQYVSYTRVSAGIRKNDDDPFHRVIRITGFGHSFDVGADLDPDGGWEVVTGDASMVFRFQDDPTNATKRLVVRLSLKRLPVSKAKAQAGMRRISLPALDNTCWSLTLPPIPEEVEQDGCGQPATRSDPEFSYDEFIAEPELRKAAIKAVNAYINKNTTADDVLIVKGNSNASNRKFKVVSVFDVLSRKGETYTIQVDVDEIDKEPRHLLLFELKKADAGFDLTGVRYNGRHLRQTLEQFNPGDTHMRTSD